MHESVAVIPLTEFEKKLRGSYFEEYAKEFYEK